MATEYRLTLAGDVPLDVLAGVVAPEGVEESAVDGRPRVLSADLSDRCGYTVSIYAGSHGYFEAEDADGSVWEWEPERYVTIGFRLGKGESSDRATREMLASVARVLGERAEDAALILDADWLLLTRFSGRLHRHAPSWWGVHDGEDLVGR
ncbi:SitI3 family protein [Micromonospora sp. WMMD956]|uniref:SitI3 family protein n=1 Tax=Micromonospora sp. WMMD956 TaxID=3016108 RepID=UPI0024168574|nr:SitI3 family protein [Micromonospora sp. WMMD956]MDG4817521.1 SitI3 family protein [Micromonospora sp. WMMD956]